MSDNKDGWRDILLYRTGGIDAVCGYTLVPGIGEEQSHAACSEPSRAEAPSAREVGTYRTDLILSYVPDFPVRILVAGTGSGRAFSALVQMGYKVCGICPDGARAALLREQLGKSQNMLADCRRLEDLEAPPESFDLLLFQEFSRCIEPLAIFSKAFDLLSDGGNILMAGKFNLSRPPLRNEDCHSLADVLILAERAGFELIEHVDLPDIDTLMTNHSLHVDDGRSSYVLLQFRRKALPKWRVGILEKKHISEILNLFERIFGHRMTPEMRQWKYAHEKNRALGVWRGNRLTAHYGGMLRDILLLGQPEIAVQIGDVMVDPSERGILTRRGPIFLMAAAFQEGYIGFGKTFLTAYGFPNGRHMRVAERLGIYAGVGNMTEVEWKPVKKTPFCLTRLKTLEKQSIIQQTAGIEILWSRMATDLRKAIVGVRDSTYLRYRYLDHPHHNYQILLVVNRFSERIRGLIVLRHDASESEIMDLVAPLHEMPLLVAHARRVAGIKGKNRLFLRIPKNFSDCFIATQGTLTNQEIPIPTPIWSHAPACEVMCDRWWLTGGDMDFI